MRSLSKLLWIPLAFAGCAKPVEVKVEIIDPCNRQVLDSVDFLKFEPRGEGIDSVGLTTIQQVSQRNTQPVEIPLAADFHLVVTGHRGDFQNQPSAIGVSAKQDLSDTDTIDIKVPFAEVDDFYRTTSLTPGGECTTPLIARYGATATFLPDSGRVLIMGGAQLGDGVLEYPRIIELYNPTTGEFDQVGELPEGGARAFHTATLLQDGRVLIAGGEAHLVGTRESLRSALVIDPTDPTNVKVSETGIAMQSARTGHTAVLLSDGRVVLVGGRILNTMDPAPENQTYLRTIEIYDPDNKLFVQATDMAGNRVELNQPRFGHSATRLATGFDIAIVGGMDGSLPVPQLEIIRVNGNVTTVNAAAETTGVGPIFHAAALAENGTLLLSGGYETVGDISGMRPINSSRAVEMWTFNEGSVSLSRTCSANLNRARGYHTVSMAGRQAVFIGGRDETGAPIADAEVAVLALGGNCFAETPSTKAMTDARAEHSVATIETSGEILVVGGRQQEAGEPFGRSINSSEIFSPRRQP